MSKEIAVSASIDIGKNITSLIEQLAQQIGTTADKVFPWYVKQQVIEGYMWIILTTLTLVLSIVMLSVAWKKSDFDNGNLQAVFVVISIVLLCGSILCALFGDTTAISKIINPQYHALHSMTVDMSGLVGK